MVSSSNSSPAKQPALSYAERAKKAQNIKSPISAPPLQRTAPHSVLSNDPTPAQSIASAPSVSNSTSTADDESISTAIHSTHSSPPTSLFLHEVTDAALTNGNNFATNDLATKALSIVAAHTAQQRSPIVNVWNLRKEQMAAAAHSSSQNTQNTGSQTVPSALKKSDAAQSSSSIPSPSGTGPNSVHGPISPKPAINGVASLAENEAGDPFVVRPPPRIPRTVIIPLTDAESWPEVGKSPSTHAPSSVSGAEHLIVQKGDSGRTSGSQQGLSSTPTTPRKSEKPKWVPIPPEELQAAADAMHKHSRSHSGKRSHNNNQFQLPPQNPKTTGSGPDLTRDSHSGRNSATHSSPHSRIQSRSGSLQSSPRASRGRRLPGDETQVMSASGYSSPRAVSNRASGPSSPQIQVRLLADLPQPVDRVPAGQPITYPIPVYDPDTVGNVPIPSYALLSQNAGLNNEHFRRTSPRVTPPQSHTPYLQNGTLLSLPIAPSYPGPGVSYPVYTAYGPYEPSTPPLAYWSNHPSRSGSGHQSPAYLPNSNSSHFSGNHPIQVPPQPHRRRHLDIVTKNEIVPFPLLSHAPPPEKSDPVSGYKPITSIETERIVGKKLPIFGSIGIAGASRTPSPALTANTLQEKAIDNPEKAFTAFSIGVPPGEMSSARLRSRTRPSKSHIKAPGVDVLQPELQHAVNDGLSESNVNAITGAESLKWEFGTTFLREEKSGADELAALDSEDVNLGSSPAVSTQENNSDAPPLVLNGLSAPASDQPQLTTHLGDSEDAPDEFEVKDFGYGFGPASGTGYAPTIVREERQARQREREKEKERIALERKEKDLEALLRSRPDVPPVTISRNRRGSFGSGFGYERNGFVRRGRGTNGYSRGYNRNFNRSGSQPQQRQPPFSITPPPLFQPIVTVNDPTNGFYSTSTQPQVATYIPTGFEPYHTPVTPVPPSQLNPPVPVPMTSVSFPLDPTRWYLLGQLEYYLSPQNMAQDFFLRQHMDSKGWIHIPLIASFNRVKRLTTDVNLVRDVLILSSIVRVNGDWVRMGGWERFVLPDAIPSAVEDAEQGPSKARVHNYRNNLAHSEEGALNAYSDSGHSQRAFTTEEPLHQSSSQPDSGDGNTEIDGEMYNDEDDDEDIVFVMGKETGVWTPERHA